MERPAIPGYELLRPLGRGSYSQVFLAQPERGDSLRALKILKPEFSADNWALACFRREGAVGTTVKHPSLVAIAKSSRAENLIFHDCAVVPGQPLRDAALLPIPLVLDVVRQIAEALGALHKAGFVHGDVKPGNIMLAPNGRASLIDLGFARRPGTLPFGDALPGTPNYLAPELCCRSFCDTPAGDIFALGVAAFELLTGHLPYPKLMETREVLLQHRDERPESLKHHDVELSPRIVKLIDAMLAVDLFARPKASQIAYALNPRSRSAA